MKKGDLVKWKHKTPDWFGGEIIDCSGVIEKIYLSSVGGKRTPVKVAKINLLHNKYFGKIARKTTIIKLDKLSLK